MTGDAAQFLLSEQGASILADLNGRTQDSLEAGRYLRRTFPDIPAQFLAAAIELTIARTQAAHKFDRAQELFFTREALEQATGSRIAEHRAQRFAGLETVYDLCSSVGGDAIALGQVAGTLVCVDNDPARVLFCRENLRILGINGVVREDDVSAYQSEAVSADAVFIDPARRSGGRRTSHLDAMLPPINTVVGLLTASPRGAAKLSPAIDTQSIPIPHETEWISTESGLKEAVVWTGDFIQAETTVTLLHKGISITDTELPVIEPETSIAGEYIFEPDPAIIRSGLLGRLAASLGLWRICDTIAYMTGENNIDSPFFTGYRIIESFPFSIKRLRSYLESMNAGPITIKKRGFPLLPEEVLKKLKLHGDAPATVILTRIDKGHYAFIVERA